MPEVKKPVIDLSQYAHISVKNHRVMVKEIDVDYNRSNSDIILSATEPKKEFTQGVVVVVGEGYIHPLGHMIAPTVEVGDVVYFGDMAGIDFKIRRENNTFEEVKVVDMQSVYYVDGEATDMYEIK